MKTIYKEGDWSICYEDCYVKGTKRVQLHFPNSDVYWYFVHSCGSTVSEICFKCKAKVPEDFSKKLFFWWRIHRLQKT